MDEAHLPMAIRYIELNPIRARLTDDAAAWPWSSAARHLGRKANDPLVKASSGLLMVDDWAAYLLDGLPGHEIESLERHLRTGRPLGNEHFLDRLGKRLGRRVRLWCPGPKPRRE